MNTYCIHADFGTLRKTIICKSTKNLEEFKRGILLEAFDSHGFYLFDSEREEPVDAYGVNLSRADAITIYLVKTDE